MKEKKFTNPKNRTIICDVENKEVAGLIG